MSATGPRAMGISLEDEHMPWTADWNLFVVWSLVRSECINTAARLHGPDANYRRGKRASTRRAVGEIQDMAGGRYEVI